jgi:ATP-dependent DNA ligase
MRTKFEATECVLAEAKHAVEALITIRKTDVNASGMFIQRRQKLVALIHSQIEEEGDDDDGELQTDEDQKHDVAERHRLEGLVSKRGDAPYRSGQCRGWRKVKTVAWREANRERWRLFERA